MDFLRLRKPAQLSHSSCIDGLLSCVGKAGVLVALCGRQEEERDDHTSSEDCGVQR